MTPEEEVLANLQAQEATYDFDRFGRLDAWAVGSRLVEIALDRELPIAAAIWLGDQQVFHVGLPGTSGDHDDWMRRKVALVRRYDTASWYTTLRIRGWGMTEASPAIGLDPTVHTLSGGAVPIRVRGTTVGIAVASGTHDEAEHNLVVEVLTEHARNTRTERATT